MASHVNANAGVNALKSYAPKLKFVFLLAIAFLSASSMTCDLAWQQPGVHVMVEKSIPAGSSEVHEPCDPHHFLVLIKAGSREKYQHRRNVWRNSSCPASYREFNVTYRFMLGLPLHQILDPNSHNQGAKDSHGEISDTKIILDEYYAHQDVEILSMRDVYDDLFLKTLRMVEWAVDKGMSDDPSISMVVIHDDEYCLRPRVLQKICLSAGSSKSSVYAGINLWQTAHYEGQKGFDGSFAPYFSGWLYALSADLVRDIASDPMSRFSSINVGHSEDVQMGVWVKNQADTKGRRKPVWYVTENSMYWEVEDKNDYVGKKYSVETCRPIQNFTECTIEGAGLGNLPTASACAAKITNRNRKACSDIFMFSREYPMWGCRCCSPGDVPKTGNANWALYSAANCSSKNYS